VGGGGGGFIAGLALYSFIFPLQITNFYVCEIGFFFSFSFFLLVICLWNGNGNGNGNGMEVVGFIVLLRVFTRSRG